MLSDERRNSPRTKLHRLAYIRIEPDNGGIVLNVSGDGLAFHSMNAVERNRLVRFSLQEQNRRIDVSGKLIWTDEVQKIGGVRFTSLTGEARDQLQDWMRLPEDEEERHTTLGAAFLRAFPGLGTRTIGRNSGFLSSLAAATAVLKVRAQSKLSGFAGGMVTGLLASMLAGSVFYLAYSYRHQFGESLIHVGERLAQKPAQPQTAPTANQQPSAGLANQQPIVVATVSTATQNRPGTDNNSAKQSALPVDIKPRVATNAPTPKMPSVDAQVYAPNSRPTQARAPDAVRRSPFITPTRKSAPEPRSNPAVLKEPRQKALGPTAAANARASVAVPAAVNLTADREPEPALISAAAAAPPSSISTSTVAPRESVDVVSNHGSPQSLASVLQMFFDLGKFKQQSVAEELSEQVAHLGLRSSVVPRGHLWMSSYQVLVGPYTDTAEEKKISADLTSHGYKPRPFERGSRGFAFRSKVTVERTKLPVGDCTISWESYVAEAKVKFEHDRDVVATTAKWIKRPKKFSENEYVYRNRPDGSRPLAEIHFAGLDRALVFVSTP